jgi:hypothetical protein
MHDPVTLVGEGPTDTAVARRLLNEAGFESGPEYVTGGKSRLDQRLPGYNEAGRHACWLVLRDLDQDAACAPELVGKLLRAPAAHIRLHIVVRAVEAWLLADGDAMARALSVRASRVPGDPESELNPKNTLLDLARQSRRRAIREALLPADGTGARVGPGYAAFLIEFATGDWSPARAAQRSPSLDRLRTFLRKAAEKKWSLE